jgi:hypothetical protein
LERHLPRIASFATRRIDEVTMTSETITANPLADYDTPAEAARIRDKTERTLRLERQRGEGPPWVRDGKKVYYPREGFRAWLKANERQPVRGPGVKVA